MAFTFGKPGPPFSFGGNLSASQLAAFKSWVATETPKLAAVQVFHQIRAQQQRKTAGMLEQYYASAKTPLAPTFVKATWTPNGVHFSYAQRIDHTPAMAVGAIKEVFRPALIHMDDAVFHMNHLRAGIERQEDKAQFASGGVARVADRMALLDNLFTQPEYQATLVSDLTDLYKGQPRFRVNQLDDPTPWERDTRSLMSPD